MRRRVGSQGQDDVARRLERLVAACREKGLRLTSQRRILMESLVEFGDHPSAEQLYSRVQEKLPGLSRATVFRILEQLVAGGVIGKASHPGRGARYDARTEHHHHLLCLRCESMIDIFDESLDRLALPDAAAHNFEMVDFRVQLRGYCSKCRRQARKNRNR